MKFLVTKDLQHSALLGNLMTGVVFALLFYFILDMVLHAYVVGLDVPTLSTTLFGNSEEFIEPILIDTLLLQVHIDLFMSLFAIMIVASIYIRLNSTKAMTKRLVHILFILGLLSPLFLMAAYFTNVVFVYVWLVSFILGHLLGMFMSLLIVKRLLFK